jgi:hypothetical protein
MSGQSNLTARLVREGCAKGLQTPERTIEAIIAERDRLRAALQCIADESLFNQLRFADEDDTDYFLRCFRTVKHAARTALDGAEPQP